MFVTFFNGVTGLVGLSQLSNTFVDNPEKVYTVGQVVKCHVLTCDAQKKRISLSFLVSFPVTHLLVRVLARRSRPRSMRRKSKSRRFSRRRRTAGASSKSEAYVNESLGSA